MVYSGSGIIPIIKDSNDKYYFVLFVSNRNRNRNRNRNKNNKKLLLLEDAGGNFEGDNIKMSAIRELKEESSMLFNLEEFADIETIRKLNWFLNNFNINLLENNYMCYFVYLGIFNLDELAFNYKSNNSNFWKYGYSVYTENKDIVFMPITNIKNIKKNIIINQRKYELFDRTLKIFKLFNKKYNLETFLNDITKNLLELNKYKIKNIIIYK